MKIKIDTDLIDYQSAVLQMEDSHAGVVGGTEREMVWLLEHNHVYTAGISAQDSDLLTHDIPVFKTKRGGKITYHGPRQQICYLIIDIKTRAKSVPDIRRYVQCLEEIVIKTIADFGIIAMRKEGYIGVWVCDKGCDKKIAAIGVKFSKGVTMHGFALNVDPDLSKFSNIIPCGIKDFGVCSLKSLGVDVLMEDVRKSIVKNINWAESVNFFQA